MGNIKYYPGTQALVDGIFAQKQKKTVSIHYFNIPYMISPYGLAFKKKI